MLASSRFVVAVLVSVLFFGFIVIFPLETRAAPPFGGQITDFFKECVAPPAILLTVGPPRGAKLMYVFGKSFSYAYGPPRGVGQWLLGLYGGSVPCMVPCEQGLCLKGVGKLIIFHGSSR